ncbi:hypothetical protein H9654_08875 [Stenotrophomonas sp. Sa5BUN4]|uniref:Uncharacterized protein n=1 Tax=Stenotrophomonas lacuserhaii TaxID=2760084 RepID=A0A8X8K3P1_9GAMM|nr:hypothetical protein [Stenotrophomonas pennii]MBD7954319.1 hypothetical protein [Stenotrophomonas pennii]
MENENLAHRTSALFDFETREEGTATLNCLLAQLNAERKSANGELITLRSLKRTLNFLEKSLGIVVDGRTSPLPLSTIKTIKLLFVTDADSDRNIFKLIARPQRSAESTMEFSTVTTTPRDADSSATIACLLDTLSKEIDPEKIQMFTALLGETECQSAAERLLLHAERTGDEVFHTLSEHIPGDDCALSNAYRSLGAYIGRIHATSIEGHRVDANEAVYVHLRTLAFQHFILHHPRHLEMTRVEGELANIKQEANQLCRLAANSDTHHQATARVFSVNTYHHLVQGWPKEVAELVEKATGFATSVKQLKVHERRAKALLASYAYRTYDCTDPSALVLSVGDIVSAIASFRYQQETGGNYKPYWPGQTDQGKDPQRHFDKGLNADDPHQHQGVIQIYLNRFYQYQAVFNGTTESHRAWMDYQGSLLNAYHSVLKLNSIVGVTTGLTSLGFLCLSFAKDHVIEHLNSNRSALAPATVSRL